MNQFQENRLSMFYAVQRVMLENNAIWSGTAAIVTTAGDLDARITSLEEDLQTQVRDITGHSKDKTEAEDAMIAQTLDVAGKVMAYATAQGDQALAEAMDITPTELRRYRDSVVAQRCQDVHDSANAVLASLAGYGVDAAKLTALQVAIDAYLSMNPAPRVAITERKNATTEIELLVGETLDLLNRRLDGLIQGYSITEPDFHRQYTDARIIVDLGGREEEPPVPPTP